MVEEKTDSGIIRISDEAVATIASAAARGVPGVIDLDGGAATGFAEMLGIKNEIKGIKVDMHSESVSLEINLVVEFGRDISIVATKVQEEVKDSIEKMASLYVEKVNVNINSVRRSPPAKLPDATV